MQLNRREWLMSALLGSAAMALSPLDILAKEISRNDKTWIENPAIRLCYNENPFGVSPSALQAMSDSLIHSSRYSFNMTHRLTEKLKDIHGLANENFIMAAGSSYILELVTRYTAIQKGHVIYPDPSFSIFTSIAEFLGMDLTAIPLDKNKKIDLPEMQKAIRKDTRLIYLCNPNNPTGDLLAAEDILEFIKAVPKDCLVLLDEAYIEFSKENSLAEHVSTYKNLLISRTFSKIYGLAGARLGYAIAHPETIKDLKKLMSWSGAEVSSVTAAAGLAAIDDATFIDKVVENNSIAMKYTEEQFLKMGLNYISSSANFLYFSLENYHGDYFQKLKDNHIQGGRTYEENGKWTRISIGTLEQMKQYITAIS